MDKINKDQLTFMLDSMFDDDDDIMYDLLQDSDGEEEVILEFLSTREKRKEVGKDVTDTILDSYTEFEFLSHFRVTRELFETLVQKFEATEIYQSLRPDKRCSARKHMAVFLWFAGHEMCSFRNVAKQFDLSISTVSSLIERTVNYISSLSSTEIVWPDEEAKHHSSIFFASKSGFHRAFGCLGLTHITIDRGNECDEGYIDRDGNVSVCLQGICNENRKFINIFVGHPGSASDAVVYQNSAVANKISNECGDYYVLGSLAYVSTANLITPYKDTGHLTSAQRHFNDKLDSARVLIYQTFSILKQRFPQLNCVKLRDMSKVCHFVRACCALHNIADEDDLEFSLATTIMEAQYDYMCHSCTTQGKVVRDTICQELQEAPKPVTNKKQMEILAEFMLANPDIARTRNIKTQAERWQELAKELNKNGPPARSWDRWTKIWTSLKYQIKRKKDANEQRAIPRPGKKVRKIVPYTQFEETVLALLEEDPLALDNEVIPKVEEKEESDMEEQPKVKIQFIPVQPRKTN